MWPTPWQNRQVSHGEDGAKAMAGVRGRAILATCRHGRPPSEIGRSAMGAMAQKRHSTRAGGRFLVHADMADPLAK